MKNNNFILFVTALVIGLIVGVGVIGLKGQNTQAVPKKNIAKEKQIYFNGKLKPPPSPGHFWRMTIFKSQYDTMTKILSTQHLPTPVDAFRLTVGSKTKNNYFILIDGIDTNGSVIPNTSKTTDMGTCQPNFVIIYLTMDQYNAMKKIQTASNLKTPVSGFRLTPGNTSNGTECIVVCGVDQIGNDIKSTTQNTFSVEPCPPNCDCNKTKGPK